MSNTLFCPDCGTPDEWTEFKDQEVCGQCFSDAFKRVNKHLGNVRLPVSNEVQYREYFERLVAKELEHPNYFEELWRI